MLAVPIGSAGMLRVALATLIRRCCLETSTHSGRGECTLELELYANRFAFTKRNDDKLKVKENSAEFAAQLVYHFIQPDFFIAPSGKFSRSQLHIFINAFCVFRVKVCSMRLCSCV